MKKKDIYNWWEDPKNEKEINRISWWNHPENQTTIELPIAIIHDGDYWVASTNTKDKEKYLGDRLHACSQGKTREEAIDQLFKMIRVTHWFAENAHFEYQRWVPFRKGHWSSIGGIWFAIFGFHVYFRYGKNMKGGWFFPLTKLNISFSSDWSAYRRWKNKNKAF